MSPGRATLSPARSHEWQNTRVEPVQATREVPRSPEPRGPMRWHWPPRREVCGGTTCPPSAPHPCPRTHPTTPLSPPRGGMCPPGPCSSPPRAGAALEEVQLFPLLGLCRRRTPRGSQHEKQGASRREQGVTPPHPTLGCPMLPQQHPEAHPALGVEGAGLGATSCDAARFTRQEKGAPSVPLRTPPCRAAPRGAAEMRH